MSELCGDLGCREAPVEGRQDQTAFAQRRATRRARDDSREVATRSPGASPKWRVRERVGWTSRRVRRRSSCRIELNGASPRRLSRPVFDPSTDHVKVLGAHAHRPSRVGRGGVLRRDRHDLKVRPRCRVVSAARLATEHARNDDHHLVKDLRRDRLRFVPNYPTKSDGLTIAINNHARSSDPGSDVTGIHRLAQRRDVALRHLFVVISCAPGDTNSAWRITR